MNRTESELRENKNQEESKEEAYKTYHIVLIGPTGGGKSSIVNAFDCFVREINVRQNPLFESRIKENMNQEGAKVGNFRSVTSDCTSYEIIDRQKREKFIILDTPGLNDTEGSEQDDLNFNNILEHLCQLDSLQCIGLVVPASQKRICQSFSYAIKRLTSLIPEDHLKNIILLATNHDGGLLSSLKNLVYECTGIEGLKSMKVFGLTNRIFSDQEQLRLIEDGEEREGIIEDMNQNYQQSMNKIKILKDYISKDLKAFSIQTELKMLKENDEKARLKLLELKNAYLNLLEEKEKLEHLKADILDLNVSMDDLKNKISTTKKFEWVLQDCSYHNTVCGDCLMIRIHSVCHEDCSLEYCEYMNGDIFKRCFCIKNSGRCNQCGCSSDSHMHIKKKPVCIETQQYKSLQSEFHSKEDKQKTRQNLENSLNGEIKKIDDEIEGFSTEIKTCINEIHEKFPKYNITYKINNDLDRLEKEIKVEQDPTKASLLRKAFNSIKDLSSRLLSLFV